MKSKAQQEFENKEKFVLGYFKTLWSEIRDSIENLRNGNNFLLKSEICLAFIGADSLSRFKELLETGKEEKNNEDRFRDWLDNFVLNDKNEVYKNNKNKIKCNSYDLYKLRSSLIHFYGLPSFKDKLIGFSSLDENSNKKFKELVKQDEEKSVMLIDPYILIDAILQGFLTQLEITRNMIKDGDQLNHQIYISGIIKIYEIVQYEGSSFFKKDK